MILKKYISLFTKRQFSILAIILPGLLLCVIALCNLKSVEHVENIFLGKHIQHTKLPKIPEKIVIIQGSDESIQKIGTWPWPRDVYAKLLTEHLKKSKVVAMDIMFLDRSLYDGDDKLVNAIEENGNVILGYTESSHHDEQVVYSDTKFMRVAVGEGYTNGYKDKDGISRKYRFFIDKGNGVTAPSFACAILMAAGYNPTWEYQQNGMKNLTLTAPNGTQSHIILDKDNEFLRLLAPKSSFEVYEFADVLEGKIDNEAFEDAIVFIGFSASGASDVITTVTGVEHGTNFQKDSLYTLISGINPVPMSSLWSFIIILLLYIVCVHLVCLLDNRISFLVPLSMLLVWLIMGEMLFKHNIMSIPSFLPIVSIVLSFFSGTLYKLLCMQKDLKIRTISLDSLFSVTSGITDINQFTSFSEYLMTLSTEIESLSEVHIIEPMLNEENTAFKNFPKTNDEGRLRIAYNANKSSIPHLILLELPKIDEQENKQQYTLLGMERKVPLEAIKSVTAVIITGFMYFHASKEAARSNQLFMLLLNSIISAVDAKDPITSGHSQRVSTLSKDLACWMGLSKTEIQDIGIAALVHDVGKIGIPDSVLGKPAPLSKEEFELMRSHPIIGKSILEGIEEASGILEGIMYHHERPDGKGYPYGKTHDEISLAAHIVKVADVFDALSTERQYKKAWPLERVLDMLMAGKGTEFHEEVVDILVQHIKPSNWEFTPKPKTVTTYNPFLLNKTKEIASEFLTCYQKKDYQKKQFKISDYFHCINQLGGVKWYEGYYTETFLKHKPIILKAESNVVIFEKNDDAISTLYYFLRNFLTMGAITFHNSIEMEVLDYLQNQYGKYVLNDDNCYIWDLQQMVIIFYKEISEEIHAVAYVMKSILEEKEI